MSRWVYQRGVPANVERDTAVGETLQAAAQAAAQDGHQIVGDPVSVTVVATPAHVEAGEFLVRMELEREPAEGGG